MTTHTCAWTDCQEQIEADKTFCRPHWWKLEPEMRAKVFKDCRANGHISADTMRIINALITDYDKEPT